MKASFTIILLFCSLLFAPCFGQHCKCATIPVKKAVVKKPAPKKKPVKKTVTKKLTAEQLEQKKVAQEAAIAKAREDSVAAVHALALQMAREIIREDSIREAEITKQFAKIAKLRYELAASGPKKKRNRIFDQNINGLSRLPPNAEWVHYTVIPDSLETGPKIWIGLRGMGSISIVPKDEHVDPYIGYGGGLVANFGGKHLSFQPEVLYAQQGITGKMADSAKYSTVVNVIQVPLLLKYSFGSNNKGFFVNVGPYGSYILNAVTKVEEQKDTWKPEKFTLEYGVSGGFGVSVPAGSGRFLVEARGSYYLGTTLDVAVERKFLTGAVSVGYLFSIGH